MVTETNNNLEELPGVGKGTADKMREGGIYNVMSVATLTPGQLVDVMGGTAAGARKIIKAARDMCKLGFETGTVFEQDQLSKKLYIPTHCSSVDNALGGGLRLGTTMEAFGSFSSGKTNLGHLLAVSTIKSFPES